jgi:hypothetical protein
MVLDLVEAVAHLEPYTVGLDVPMVDRIFMIDTQTEIARLMREVIGHYRDCERLAPLLAGILPLAGRPGYLKDIGNPFKVRAGGGLPAPAFVAIFNTHIALGRACEAAQAEEYEFGIARTAYLHDGLLTRYLHG